LKKILNKWEKCGLASNGLGTIPGKVVSRFVVYADDDSTELILTIDEKIGELPRISSTL
jgi:hypothetical protein